MFGVDDRADQVLLAGLAEARRSLAGHRGARGLRRTGGRRWRPMTIPTAGWAVALPGRSRRRHPPLPGRQAQRLGPDRGRPSCHHPRGPRGGRRGRDPHRSGRGGPGGVGRRRRPSRPSTTTSRVDRPPGPWPCSPQRDRPLDRSFVTVVHLLPGGHGPIGAWADRHLAGLEVYDDLSPCTGGALMGLASGADRAVLDPRPLLAPRRLRRPPLRPRRPGRGPRRRRRHRGPAPGPPRRAPRHRHPGRLGRLRRRGDRRPAPPHRLSDRSPARVRRSTQLSGRVARAPRC